MAKQVKIGFERVPVPVIDQLQILYDKNTGIPLKSGDGRPLYTNEKSPIKKFGDIKNSLSCHVNNETDRPAKINEQFPETSQVSNSLLGIPRSETQLSLFSDVSIYGLDENIWEFFRSPVPNQPQEWISRENPTYGNRYYPRLDEIDNEQALAINAFPTPWTFPFGPRFADTGQFNQNLFANYQRFINLGNDLYDFYSSRGLIEFAESKFLNRTYATNLPGENDIFYNELDFTIQRIFSEIEKWTLTWMDLRDGKLFDPDSNKINFPSGFDATNTRPGYSSLSSYYAELQSKRVFRYQPGRISGFTFGVRASTDAGSAQNIIEWGCANDTDEYMFQIKGSQFNIVRRSTIPLPRNNLERMNLNPDLQNGDQKLKAPLNPWRSGTLLEDSLTSSPPVELWEIVIPRNLFNGDALDGNGPSGYIISFEEVTMYKIEFSWYGAIGAKFYAYVPAGNGDARWVLIHTIVIENELGNPCLNDPFFKFRYLLYLTDTSNLKFPQYIYKYGASYYIDGGDEGTVTNHSYSSNVVSINPSNSRSLIGVTAKNSIYNRDGVPVKNRKDIIPIKMNVSSTEPTRFDIIECEGCPGHSHHYAPSLRSGQTGVTGILTVDISGKNAQFEPTNENLGFSDYIYENDSLYSKVIVDGLYSTYLYNLGDGKIGIARRNGSNRNNNEPSRSSTFENVDQVRLSNGSLKAVKTNLFQNARISRWDHITASSVPLVKKNIKVNFLNPAPRDSSRFFAEFFIGVTDKTPEIDPVAGQLTFSGDDLDLTELLFVDYAPYYSAKDLQGFDTIESDPRVGTTFEMDSRLKSPPGVDSGRCSYSLIEVRDFDFDANYSNTNPVTGSSGNFLIFQTSTLLSFNKLKGGELAAQSEVTGDLEGLGIFFEEDKVTSYQEQQTQLLRYYIPISTSLATSSQIKLYLKAVSIKGRYVNKSKIFPWNLYPLYVVIGMRDNSQINNVTIEEYDEISKFSHTPTWLKSENSTIEIIYSGVAQEGIITDKSDPRLRNNIGLYQTGGFSDEGFPAENFTSKNRLDSAQIDTQLQQPLRPGEIKSSFFVGANETLEVDLNHLFGSDRSVITPGTFNTKATFIIARTLSSNGEVQISLNTKEQ